MFHFIWIVPSGYGTKMIQIMNFLFEHTFYYDKMIFYFEEKVEECALYQHPLFIDSSSKSKIEFFDFDLYRKDPKVMESKCTIGFVMSEIAHLHQRLCTFLFVDALEITHLLPMITYNVQRTLTYGIQCEMKDPSSVMIASYHFDHVWIKKLFFELKYRSLTPHMVSSRADCMRLLHELYHKYAVVYAKDLVK